MKPRKRARTAQIKPETRNAIMDQFACAADEIERLKAWNETLIEMAFAEAPEPPVRRWWSRLHWVQK